LPGDSGAGGKNKKMCAPLVGALEWRPRSRPRRASAARHLIAADRLDPLVLDSPGLVNARRI
jgi:hypothetical protein